MAHPHLRRGWIQRGERRGGQGERTALAGPADRDPFRIHAVEPGGRLHRADGVHEQPREIVVLGAGDAPGHHGRVLGARRAGPVVAGRARAPPAALATGVHHQDRVSRRGQRGVLGGCPAPAAVADERHHDRRRFPPRAGRAQIPAADPVTAGAGELHVVDLEGTVDAGLVAGEPGRPGHGAGLGQARAPPLVQGRGLGGRRPVLAELLQGQVVPRHTRLPASFEGPLPSLRAPTLSAGRRPLPRGRELARPAQPEKFDTERTQARALLVLTSAPRAWHWHTKSRTDALGQIAVQPGIEITSIEANHTGEFGARRVADFQDPPPVLVARASTAPPRS